MKNSKEYSPKIHKLYRSLKRKYPKVQRAVYHQPADALVYAVVSENISDKAARSAIKILDDYFVDLNDLRVSQVEEIVEVLREDTPVTRDIASTLTRSLGAVFSQYNTVSLEPLKKIGKRPAKQALEKMGSISRFAVNFCCLTSLQGHAIPLTKKMIEFLRSNQLVHPKADQRDIEGFLTRQISAENTYEFYALLRRQSESRSGRGQKKTTRPACQTGGARKAKAKKTAKTKKKT